MHPLSFTPCDTPGAFDALVGIHTETLAWVRGEIAQAFATAGSSAVDAPDPDGPTELVHALCAQRLYAAHGFTDCAPYEGSEVPPTLRSRWRFMQRTVGGLPGAMQAQPQPGRHARASGP